MKPLFIVALLLAGCGDDKQEYPILGKGTSNLFDRWDADCRIYHGVPCNYDGLTIKYGDFEGASPDDGAKCVKSAGRKTVLLSQEVKNMGASLGWAFYRHMGFCVLDRHADGSQTVTIMGGASENYNNDPGVREIMVKDLFQRSEPTQAEDPLGIAQ